MNKIINKYKLILLFVLLLVLDGLFFGFTDPSQISQVLLLFGFVLAGLTTYVFMVLILRYLKYIGFKLKNESRISIIVTIVIVIALALESIGQFSTVDLVTLLIFCLILYVYLGAISSNKRFK